LGSATWFRSHLTEVPAMQAERKARIYVTSYYDHPKNASIVSSFCVYTLKLFGMDRVASSCKCDSVTWYPSLPTACSL